MKYIKDTTFISSRDKGFIIQQYRVPTDEFDKLVEKYELQGIAVIKAYVSYKHIEKDIDLLESLLQSFVQFKLYQGITDFEEKAERARVDFYDMLNVIRENQKAVGIYANSEEKEEVEGTSSTVKFL